MVKLTDQAAKVVNQLQERLREQTLIHSLTGALSLVLNKQELSTIINSKLKEELLFDDFILASAVESETVYQVFYHYLAKDRVYHDQPIYDGYFDRCVDSPDTVLFDLKVLSAQKDNLPAYMNIAQDKGFRNGIGTFLPYIKGNRNVIFLFFKDNHAFSRESSRILKGISMQLSVTMRNLLLMEKYEKTVHDLTIQNPIINKKYSGPSNLKEAGFEGVIGNSKAMQNIYELITQVAHSQTTVLITGETGTGKELVASAIHNLSSVSKNKMIRINCAAIPETLIESELFGHEKGAFTGALETKIGKFEQAHNSTIFLDEIGEMPLALQGKLLRVLQEREIERIGGKKTIKINVRIIAATNRSLENAVVEGRFRSDLYYRLCVYLIELPSLRDRIDDVEMLSNFFLEKHAEKNGKKIKGFSKKVMDSMKAYAWPGNIRELENMVERSVLFEKDKLIKEMLFPTIHNSDSTVTASDFYTKTLQEVEKEHILQVVKKCNGRISGPQGAAVILNLPGTTLISKMQKLGIKKEHFY